MKVKKSPKTKFDRDTLAVALLKEGFELNRSQLDRLWQFHGYLRKRNPELNMTRLHSFSTIVRKHYIDCLLVLRWLKEAGIELRGKLLDLGSGPGFPGVPLSIMRPDLEIVLAEGRNKRVEFLREVVEMLQLNASVFGNRVHAGQGQNVQAVITRAVENMADTLRHCQGNTTAEALFIFMKGPNCDEEIEQVKSLGEFDLLLDKAYTLPESTDHRRLIVWKQKAGVPGDWISSADNKKFKQLKSLNQTRQIKKQGRCLISGEKITAEFLRGYPERCRAVLAQSQMALPESVLRREDLPVWRFSAVLFKELDTMGTNKPLLLFDVPEMEPFDPLRPGPGLQVIIPLSDPENLGAALRSAAAFPPAGLVITSEAAHPFHPRALRAASGQTLRIKIKQTETLDHVCKELQLPHDAIFGLDMQGEDVEGIEFPEDCILVLGEEGRGLPIDFKGRRVCIPMDAAVESLNASVALSIVLYTISRQK